MPPIPSHKHYDRPSVFQATGLLREARRQKRLPDLRPRPAGKDPIENLFIVFLSHSVCLIK